MNLKFEIKSLLVTCRGETTMQNISVRNFLYFVFKLRGRCHCFYSSIIIATVSYLLAKSTMNVPAMTGKIPAGIGIRIWT